MTNTTNIRKKADDEDVSTFVDLMSDRSVSELFVDLCPTCFLVTSKVFSYHSLTRLVLSPYTSAPSQSLLIMIFEVVRSWRERDRLTDSLYNCERELRENSASVQYHSQWEDRAHLSTAAGTAAAATAAIYCNYLNPLKEIGTVELFVIIA